MDREVEGEHASRPERTLRCRVGPTPMVLKASIRTQILANDASLSHHDVPVDQRQRRRQPLGMAQNGKGVAAEDGGEVGLRLAVDGDAEDRVAEAPRLADGARRVLDAVASLVVVEIVGLAVGKDEQQPMLSRARRSAPG